MTPEAKWKFSKQNKLYEIGGTNNSIATKIGQDPDLKNYTMVECVMGERTGKHTISLILSKAQQIKCLYSAV